MKRWVDTSFRTSPLRLCGLTALTSLAFMACVWLCNEGARNLLREEWSKVQVKLLVARTERKYHLGGVSQDSLILSNEEERVLLHLPERGLPGLAVLLDSGNLYTWAGSTLFLPEPGRVSNCVLANRRACFRLVRELAPSPEALRLDKQAGELATKITFECNNSKVVSNRRPTQSEVLDALGSIRAFYEQLKDLPKMSPKEFAQERAESAVMARAEYLYGFAEATTPEGREWPYQQLERQKQRGKEGYLLAYAECTSPLDYERFQMVIKKQGGIFEANQMYSGSHFHPDSCESRLSPAEIHSLEDFLTSLPPSDPSTSDGRFILSFSKDGNWLTRTYHSLPEGSPLQSLLHRMVRQSMNQWGGPASESVAFLPPE